MVSEGSVLTRRPSAVSEVAASAIRPTVERPTRVAASLRWAVLSGAVLTAVVTVGMAFRLVPVGSHSGHYTYHYVRLFSWEMMWPFVLVAGAVIGGLWLSRRWHARRQWTVVTGWLVSAVPMQLLLRTYDDVPLADLVGSNRANGFLAPAQQWSAWQFLNSENDLVGDLTSHAHANMAGKTIFYHLLTMLTDSPAVMGVLVIAVSSLSALLIYLIARDLLDHRAALYALVLSIIVPGKLYFLPILNVVSPVLVLLALWLHVRYLRRTRWYYALAVGVMVYVSAFFEPLPLALGLVFAALLTWALTTRRTTWAATARLVGGALAGFFACHAVMRLTLGYDLFANFAFAFADAYDYNDDGRRPYGVWVVRNLWDFAIGTGLAVAVLVAVGVFAALRRGIARPAAVLAVSSVAVLAVLDLLGVNRGETIRLWIFLAVFWQITAAWMCARTTRLWPIAVVTAAAVLQGAIGMAMMGFVRI